MRPSRRLVRRSMAATLSILALVSSGLAASAEGKSQMGAVIAGSALAPYRDFLARRSTALCDDFTLRARGELAGDAGGRNCSVAMTAFLAHGRLLTIPVIGLRKRLRVAHVEVHGADAKVVLAYGPEGATFRLALQRDRGGSWRVATKPRLGHTSGCVISGPCPRGTTTLLFWLGLPVIARTLGHRVGAE